MLFNSIDFAIFLPILFSIYWFFPFKKLKWQNLLLVIASYVFYGWWDWRFLFLLFISTILDFLVGKKLGRETSLSYRKALLWCSIIVNIGLLGFFKYCNFFIDTFISAFTFFGFPIPPYSLNIILPVGISFYTFQTLSYTIDVYCKKLAPTDDFISFMAYVSFFPQLVAGPIERATNLLPQFYQSRTFSYSSSVDGLRQMLWGFLKKIVIADNCAIYANMIFSNYTSYSGSTLVLGALFFTFQIYGDFSGYSDIAIGCARLFGFDLMQNFAFPYFSRDIAEFWRRWHISLSTWFRDYVYIPIGGSRGNVWMKIKNTMIIFLVSGFWHGANWTFLAWGFLNALYFLPLLLTKQNRKNLDVVSKGRVFPPLSELFGMIITFSLTVLAWIFFRSPSISDACLYIQQIFSKSLLSIPRFPDRLNALTIIILIVVFLIAEWLDRDRKYGAEGVVKIKSRFFRWTIYIIVVLIILFFGNFGDNEFIYFQF